MCSAKIEIVCGCGWGSVGYDIADGDRPVGPDCGYEFPEFETVHFPTEKYLKSMKQVETFILTELSEDLLRNRSES